MFDPDQAFALLADGTGLLLFTRPHGLIAGADMVAALAELRAAARAGDWLAGGFSYESGLLLEPKLAPLAGVAPFHWFGRFAAPERLSVADLAPWRADIGEITAQPEISRTDWLRMIARAQEYIAAGDIYQANLSFQMRLRVNCHPLALFTHLYSPQSAPHGGVVHDGRGNWWLSFSPELFFELQNGKLRTRPMKGTAPRQPALEADQAMARWLQQDVKNRAENLMITDLLRNDLGRVAEVGSVHTPQLFTVETYPSVHQMTSTVTAKLAAGRDALDVVQALYPCGSITGAPKLRAMQIIAELEQRRRGIYCGSLGWIGPQAQAAQFNVAIRTIAIAPDGSARLGVGAGITADSNADDEWQECLLKGQFLRPSAPDTLIETMRLEANGDIPRLGLHLARLAASATRFGFAFDRDAIEAQLRALRPDTPRRLRLQLKLDSSISLQLTELPMAPTDIIPVAVVPLPLAADDWRLWHKTGARQFHADARAAAGTFECIYERPDGLLTEGSFTNIFVDRGGRLLTPPAHLGLLPGVLRAELLADGRAIEAPLRRADLAQGFRIGNSLRGLLRARLAG